MRVPIINLQHGVGLPLPKYSTKQSSGMDLVAAIDTSVEIAPKERKLIPTGVAVALPTGYEAQVRPRSGLALQYGLTVLNSPGTIDADYRGEISVILANFGDNSVIICRGMRIAQLIVSPVVQVEWDLAASLPASERGKDGFGSSGGGLGD